MKNKIYFLAVALMCFFTACDDDDNDKDLGIADSKQLTQTAYADEANTGTGFKFTAKRDWSADVVDTTPADAANDFSLKSNNTNWLTLTNNGEEVNGGKAGQYTLKIVLDPNYTGKDRTANIHIVSGNDYFTVKVTQSAKTEDGTILQPEGKISGYDEAALYQDFPYTVSSGSFKFTTSAEWNSTVEVIYPEDATNPSWINYSPVAGEQAGTYTVNFTLEENDRAQLRRAVIKIICGNDAVQIDIKQDAYPINIGFDTGSELLNQMLIRDFDASQDGTITADEAALVEVIRLPYSSGEKISGNIDLSYFPNVTTVNLKGHEIENFTINSETLETLDLSDNKLKDFGGNYPALRTLYVSNNEISKISTGSWPLLFTLWCFDNPDMYALDISGSTYLNFVDCINNPLLEIIVVNADQQARYNGGETFIKKDSRTTLMVTN